MSTPPAGIARLLPVTPAGAAMDLRSLSVHEAHFGRLPVVDGPRIGKPGSLVHELEKSGLRGRGGGWFPTARKVHAVVESAAARRAWSAGRKPVVIANAMEGEPASSKDAILLRHNPHLVLDGVTALAATLGAEKAYIAIHRGSPIIDVVTRALADRNDPVTIELVTPPARYVSSEESALSHWIGDGVGTPVFGKRPFERGVNDRPTAVQNAETMAHIGLIARFGGEWFASVGEPTAPGTCLVSVSGVVNSPGVIEVAVGTPVSEIINRCNGFSGESSGFLTGGYGGAWVSQDSLMAAHWSPDSVAAAGGVIGAGILWALDARTCPLHEVARVAHWMAGESAGQCGPCRFGLPSLADDLDVIAGKHAQMSDVHRLNARLPLVQMRGGCKHPDGTARFIGTAMHVFQAEVAHHLRGHCCATTSGTALPIAGMRPSPVGFPGKDFK
ncbi:MAG: proton-conducting membrane transporter [Actinobacteria bacterium]|nr:proton-conducting membrane transporter [Actinomycetota bacterium]